jgi:phosphoribosyl 1,2-cyclic phosphodiesterase
MTPSPTDRRLRFASLGSGSGGNATLIECDGTCVMIDCGFSVKQTVARLERLARRGEDISAIIVTHEHSDHLSGVGVMARRFNLPVWMTPGSWRAAQTAHIGRLPELRLFNSLDRFAIGGLEVEPFPVPHDAEEPSQFVFGNGDRRIGVLTDTGASTPHIEASLDGCDALLLECNHDRDMLRNGPYPAMLKERVGGPLGHLDNDTAARILRTIDSSCLRYLVAGHLSKTNNTPELARDTLSAAIDCDPEWIRIADQERGLDWCVLD